MRNTDEIWKILEDVKDPEIPVVSVVEMGMIESVEVEGEKNVITMMPTFVGCPALQVIQEEIAGHLKESGVEPVEVRVTLSPPWSTDRITPEGRRKLREFGVTPPLRPACQVDLARVEPAICPHCGSANTVLTNPFGPTLCRAIYVCRDCKEPFEGFKTM